jgi:hypothetical protein
MRQTQTILSPEQSWSHAYAKRVHSEFKGEKMEIDLAIQIKHESSSNINVHLVTVDTKEPYEDEQIKVSVLKVMEEMI